MTLRSGVLVACAITACATNGVRLPQPPSDERTRRTEELEACRRGTLPAWLDDGALAAAGAVDVREGQASSANEQFRGALYTSQPPPSQGGARAQQVMQARREFETWCSVLRTAGKSLTGS